MTRNKKALVCMCWKRQLMTACGLLVAFGGMSGRMVSDGFVADLTAEIRDRRQVAAAQTRREAEPDNKSIVMRTQRWKEILQTLIALAPVVELQKHFHKDDVIDCEGQNTTGVRRETQPAWGGTLSLMMEHQTIRKDLLPLLMCLLASGCLCSRTQREYHLVTTSKNWTEAQVHCRETYDDLATIGSHSDSQRLLHMTEASGVKSNIWIGLTETGSATWLWSVGETETSDGGVEYTNWASSPSSSHHCGGMRDDGKWIDRLCNTELPFVCQNATGLSVVIQEMSWRKAQDHCRLNNSDLASVMSPTENLAVQNTITSNNPPPPLVWIGLFKDQWEWSDQSGSSFRDWEPSQPNDDGVCCLYDSVRKKWFDRGCASSYPFYCYGEKTIRRTTVKIELRSVVDINDFAVTEDILKRIRNNFIGIWVHWRVQRNGKIFYKKEKKEPVEACESDKLTPSLQNP